jgi:hypothetical protein
MMRFDRDLSRGSTRRRLNVLFNFLGNASGNPRLDRRGRRWRRSRRDCLFRLCAADHTPSYHRGSDPLFYDVLLFFLFNSTFYSLYFLWLKRAHVIANLDAYGTNFRE